MIIDHSITFIHNDPTIRFTLTMCPLFVVLLFRSAILLQLVGSIDLSFADDQRAADPLPPDSPTCRNPLPLGMESGALPDSAISASSSFHPHSLGPHNARIRKELGGGAWCPRQIQADSYEYIQVDFPQSREIVAIELQGRDANGSGREWTESLIIDFLRENGGNWSRYETNGGEQILAGNQDPRTPLLIPLWPTLAGIRAIRLVPFSPYVRTVCLRFELYGCENGQKEQFVAAWLLAASSPHLLIFLLFFLFFLIIISSIFLFRHFSSSSSPSGDRRGLFFGTGSSSSHSASPLRPSSSWQNVQLPFDSSNAKVYSPSFCRFESVSIGWPSLRAPRPGRAEHYDHIEEDADKMPEVAMAHIARSRSLAAACSGGQMQASSDVPIPVRPVASVQLAHSCSLQSETFVAITRPLHKKPVPTPRKGPRAMEK